MERNHACLLNKIFRSGGGQDRAFGAGLLEGRHESGHRSKFDSVDGVITGELHATYEFLGAQDGDTKLEEMYTKISKENKYKDKSVVDLLSSAGSLKNRTLRALIGKYITARNIRRMLASCAENRILTVGSTNVDYGQTWAWNTSLIAKARDIKFSRKVLLTSASFPKIFPPLEINGHLFDERAALLKYDGLRDG